MKKLIAVFLFLLSFRGYSQYVQSIHGRVIEQESKSGLPGAVVALLKDTVRIGTSETDVDGHFRFDNIPIGRYSLLVRFTGYNEQLLRNIDLISGKATVLTIELEEKVLQMNETVIESSKKGETKNEMALVSAKVFDAEETERYAGSRQDPARMASNFAGVSGSDDSRNDIIIRGNSPQGVLFRIDGVDLYNANHFALPGSTGGPVSMLNNKTIGTSDFMTGAFPAQFGNAAAGVFDINLRTGNTENYEHTLQVGILGLEAASEGPISKSNGSSYMIAYRYSTLAITHQFGIDFGTTSVPSYQDITFKLNFPIGKKDNISVFGIGGISNAALVTSTFSSPPKDLYDATNEDIYDSFKNGFVGATWAHSINNTAYMKFTMAQTYYQGNFSNDRIYRDPDFSVDTLFRRYRARYIDARSMLSWYFNKKINKRSVINAGVYTTRIYTSVIDNWVDESIYSWKSRANVATTGFLIQPFAQYKYRISDNIEYTLGLHGQYYTMSNSRSLEPRAAIKWKINTKQSLAFGTGMYSDMPGVNILYLHQPTFGASRSYNDKLGFIRSDHAVLTYDYVFSSDLRIRAEAYYQYLYDVPITRYRSSFSALNEGADFNILPYDTLVNKGTGQNKGIELTIEKFFTHHYFILATGSLFRSTYTGSDGITRSTTFDSKFITNLLAGREFPIRKNALVISGKVTFSGGRMYSPVNYDSSAKARDIRIIDKERNSLEFANYFRLDLKISYKINAKKVTHEISLDLANVTNHKNVLAYSYIDDPNFAGNDPKQIAIQYQLGFLPVFYYRLDF